MGVMKNLISSEVAFTLEMLYTFLGKNEYYFQINYSLVFQKKKLD